MIPNINMKKIGEYALYTLLICFFLACASCKSKKAITDNEKVVHDTTFIERRIVDTTIVHEADTATAKMLAECDENNQVLIHELNARDGERTKIDPVIKYVYVEDPVTGEKLRKAEIDIVATTQRLQDHINILEEKLSSAHSENEKLREEIDKMAVSWFDWMLGGFALGLFTCIVVHILIRKWL